jgi:ankyrin repeat protein
VEWATFLFFIFFFLSCVAQILTNFSKVWTVGSQVNIRDRYSFSPVHIATMYGDLQSVQLLAANGAQLDVRDHQQNLPVHYAARDQMVHILDFLLSQEPRSTRQTSFVVVLLFVFGHIHLSHSISRSVNGVNWYDFSTPLLTLLSHSPHAIHRKAKPALIGCVRRLLRHGADTTIPNGYGKASATVRQTMLRNNITN